MRFTIRIKFLPLNTGYDLLFFGLYLIRKFSNCAVKFPIFYPLFRNLSGFLVRFSGCTGNLPVFFWKDI